MTISAKIVADTLAPTGRRLTTLQLAYPRWVHGELLTHKRLSRSSMSSRAVPVAKTIAQVRNEPEMPIHWGANQPGMQAKEQLTHLDLQAVQSFWRGAAEEAANYAQLMTDYGLHKQIANRILEPFQTMHTIVTATEWEGIFKLRRHHMAEPHIHLLFDCIYAAMERGGPYPVRCDRTDPWNWHLPYIEARERNDVIAGRMPFSHLVAASAARCARVSYLNHDGTSPDMGKDLALYAALVLREPGSDDPVHASPAEHVGYPLWSGDACSGNLKGFRQWREHVEDGHGDGRWLD